MVATTYRSAGVDIEAGARAIELMAENVRSTYGPEVLLGIGAFAGLFDISGLKDMQSPVLVASTDGVGTKTKIAVALGRYDSIGQDAVNHCINDILVQGARPLFFLDYIAASELNPEMVAEVVGGCAKACRAARCALLAGETAQMPGVYAPQEFDLVGTIVGVVDRAKIIDGNSIQPGDRVLGLESSGLHTNGYSLARQVFKDWDLQEQVPELRQPLGEALLEPHRSYLEQVQRLQKLGIVIKGMAHITGGGLIDNPPRMVPSGLAIHIRRASWPVSPIFQLIQNMGGVRDGEMARTFNLGLGMMLVVDPDQVNAALDMLDDRAWAIGEIVDRNNRPPVYFT